MSGASASDASVTEHRRRATDAMALHDDTLREVLPNGLTLLIRRDRSAPVVAIVTYVKAGYFDEPDDVVGIAHVLEHMYFKGTPTRGVGQVARETKANGGYLNAHTIYDHTSYYTVLPSDAFVAGLEIQFDAYARSVIDADELARELEVIIQEAKRKRDTPHALTIESLYALLHDRHRIRRWRIGEEAMLRSFTREQVHGFYRTWYRPANTVLCVVGDVDPDVVRREVMARHGALDGGGADMLAARDRGPRELALPGRRVQEMHGDVAQQQLAFGWRAPALDHPDTPALDLAGIALGSGRASRLYRAVRERQLATSVSTWHYTSGDAGVFVAHADAPTARATEAARATWRELQSARNDGFRASEIARAQRVLEARWLRRLESMEGQAEYLAAWEAEGGLPMATAYHDALLSLDAHTVQAALVAHCDPSQVSLVSYRPDGSGALVPDRAALDALLDDVGGGSAVMASPGIPTPARAFTAVGADDVEAVRPERRVSAQRTVHGTQSASIVVHHTAHGVPVLVQRRPGAPLVYLGVVQRGGAMLEPQGHEGLARLTSQATLKGTRWRSGAEVAEASEELGGSIGVSAGLESLAWTLSVPTRHVAAATSLLAEVVQSPAFPEDAIETERALALAEVARQRDDMYRWPMRLASIAAYGAHPYARAVLGTEESLPSIDAGAVHGFHARHVLHASTALAVVGDVDVDAIIPLIERAFDGLRWQEDARHAAPVWPATTVPGIASRDKQQTAIAMLFPGPSRTDRARHTARVLSAIASGLGGRFFEQLRDKQSLAYTVSAFPVERRDAGAFAAYIATSPAREDEAREGLLREFARLVDEPPTAEELTRAKRYLIGTHQIAQQSGATRMADMVDAWLFGEGLSELDLATASIDAVTAEDLRALCTTYLRTEHAALGIVRGVGLGIGDR